jgi:O-succinylhomoserine sulfhydrylase
MPKAPDQHPETAAIRTSIAPSAHREHSSSIYMTSSFTFEDAEQARALFAREIEGAVYTRYSNPSVDEFIAKMCALEQTEDGVAVASGMSAVFTPLAALLKSGDHVVASRSVFGSTHQVITRLLSRWGIGHSYAEITSTESWERAFTANTKVCYVETPSNPALDLVDLEWLSGLCRERSVILIVDNIFATPILQVPVHFGADIVMHSATKYIDGQGRGIGGVVLGRKDLIEEVRFFARHSGPALSPFNAWMFSKSLETLAVRMDRHCDNAERLAAFLEGHPQSALVRYPHLPSHPQFDLAKKQMRRGGGIVTFEVKGGLEQGRRFLDALQMLSLTANLGDSRTIATHPASTTHSSLSEEERRAVGITPGLVRISVGLEHIDDIMADVDQALSASAR